MKTIITILTIILSTTIVSAISFYAGDTIEIPIDYEIVNCSVTNSTYDLEGLNLSWEEKNIIISTSPYYKSDNLTISCWVIKGKEIVEVSPPVHYSFGGGSPSSKKDKDNISVVNANATDKLNGTETIIDIETRLSGRLIKNIWKIIIGIFVFLLLVILTIYLKNKKNRIYRRGMELLF